MRRAQLGGHTHTENVVDDWDRQFLLPNALSQLGPGVTWFDIDRDGDEDLIVGTGKGGRIARVQEQERPTDAAPQSRPGRDERSARSVLGLAENGAVEPARGRVDVGGALRSRDDRRSRPR